MRGIDNFDWREGLGASKVNVLGLRAGAYERDLVAGVCFVVCW